MVPHLDDVCRQWGINSAAWGCAVTKETRSGQRALTAQAALGAKAADDYVVVTMDDM